MGVKFATFTDTDGTDLAVNAMLVRSVKPWEVGTCILKFDDDHNEYVEGTLAEVTAKLNGHSM